MREISLAPPPELPFLSKPPAYAVHATSSLGSAVNILPGLCWVRQGIKTDNFPFTPLTSGCSSVKIPFREKIAKTTQRRPPKINSRRVARVASNSKPNPETGATSNEFPDGRQGR